MLTYKTGHTTEIKKKKTASAVMETRNRLMKSFNPAGYWEGRLSGSPLATAVAVVALGEIDPAGHHRIIDRGLDWLAANINSDGGWGDSPESRSNLSTSLLCWSAFRYAKKDYHAALRPLEIWIQSRTGSLEPEKIAAAVLAFYGNDRTFSAPILLLCGIAGRLGKRPDCWRLIPQLPMELATLPHRLYKWARLPVVSYAIPALIAVGLAKHRFSPTGNHLLRLIRDRVTNKILDILSNIQPKNGGFLEATPLTAFVLMSLAASGYKTHRVVSQGAGFLLASQRTDGSWPIDTNLSTWVTTLAVNALLSENPESAILTERQRNAILNWLLKQQFRQKHVFTHAAPGGWSWTDLPGGVPDADDTSGVLLALKNLDPAALRSRQAAIAGIRWLLDLQNRDGGIPTFCKGWGKLDFDRSCPDITAHALRAFAVWREHMTPDMQTIIDRAIARGLRYLGRARREDGYWLPLWFGNQWVENEENPVYGTSQVVTALRHDGLRTRPGVSGLLTKGTGWLVQTQNEDGGWGSIRGAASTIEETALAIRAIAGLADMETVDEGFRWLQRQTAGKEKLTASPIGLYFASLWYDEKLYPVIFTAAAMEKGARKESQSGKTDSLA